jgi:hypothetical protein
METQSLPELSPDVQLAGRAAHRHRIQDGK